MIEIKVDVNVRCPDLFAALARLDTCAREKKQETVRFIKPGQEPSPGVPLPILNDLVNRQPEPPVLNDLVNRQPELQPTIVPATATLTIPVETPATVGTVKVPVEVPVKLESETPTYTLAQVARAGADLLTAKPALQPKLIETLGKYGASTVVDLKPENLAAFADDIRKMGAKI